MILIYTKDIDDFVNRVIDYLDDDFIRIGNRDSINIDTVSIKEDINLTISGKFFELVNFKHLKKVWFNSGFAKGNSIFENQVYSSLLDSFLTNLNVHKIGRVYHEFETNKLYASLEAQKQGFKIPETLFTDSKSKLIEFYKKNTNGIICKRIIDDHYFKDEEYVYNFNSTFLIDSKILNNIPSNFALTLFQERILAEFEVRVIYFNETFYAMSIHTFNNAIDYRDNFKSLKDLRTIPFTLPNNIKIRLERIFKNLNINYGSADLMYYNEDFYFLEINPAGQISFVNEACNFHLELEISKLLKNER